jgi:uncharacterized protein YchJ
MQVKKVIYMSQEIQKDTAPEGCDHSSCDGRHHHHDHHHHTHGPRSRGEKVGRNDPCPCLSGKKFKKCCLNKEAL